MIISTEHLKRAAMSDRKRMRAFKLMNTVHGFALLPSVTATNKVSGSDANNNCRQLSSAGFSLYGGTVMGGWDTAFH